MRPQHKFLGTNTDIWILMAESDMEVEAGSGVGLVANYATITASYKQWLAMVASHRAAFLCNQPKPKHMATCHVSIKTKRHRYNLARLY